MLFHKAAEFRTNPIQCVTKAKQYVLAAAARVHLSLRNVLFVSRSTAYYCKVFA